jgi:hypothetical protein
MDISVLVGGVGSNSFVCEENVSLFKRGQLGGRKIDDTSASFLSLKTGGGAVLEYI